MTQLNPATDTALAAGVATVVGLIEINFPGYDLRLCDGSGEVQFGAHRFKGFDDRFGVIADLGVIDAGEGNESPALDLLFHPASSVAVADLSSPAFQGSRVRLWIAALDPQTGLIIGDAVRIFLGSVDTTDLVFERGSRVVEMQAVTGYERMFAATEGNRLSNAFHTSVWPGERGFENADGVTRPVPWGIESPSRSTVVVSGGAGSNANFLGARLNSF